MDILGQKHVNSFICLLWLKILATLLFLKDVHCDNHCLSSFTNNKWLHFTNTRCRTGKRSRLHLKKGNANKNKAPASLHASYNKAKGTTSTNRTPWQHFLVILLQRRMLGLITPLIGASFVSNVTNCSGLLLFYKVSAI